MAWGRGPSPESGRRAQLAPSARPPRGWRRQEGGAARGAGARAGSPQQVAPGSQAARALPPPLLPLLPSARPGGGGGEGWRAPLTRLPPPASPPPPPPPPPGPTRPTAAAAASPATHRRLRAAALAGKLQGKSARRLPAPFPALCSRGRPRASPGPSPALAESCGGGRRARLGRFLAWSSGRGAGVRGWGARAKWQLLSGKPPAPPTPGSEIARRADLFYPFKLFL
ncbi:uncharacterized protein ACOB8E_001045 isoform 1-T2 [Sarcophilus harrisii]